MVREDYMKKGVSHIAIAAACGALFASESMAQTPSDAKASATAISAAGDGEIVVTANRRAENVQKVPISISVLSSDDLTAAGVTTSEQLTLRTTNLQMGNINAQPLIYIRGMGSAILNPGAEGTVGLYMDGVYLPWATSIDQSFLDVERVEVLKGPQGSLYGRNTTAGAINFITRDPARERAAELSATLGTWGTQNLSAFVSSGPGTVAASIAGQVTRHNPFIKNLGSGPDYQDKDEIGLRGKIKFEPSSGFSVVAAVDWARRDDHNQQGFISLNDQLTAANPARPGRYTVISRDPEHTYSDWPSLGERYRDLGGSLTIRAKLPFADFVSITAGRDTLLTSSPDTDASDLPLTGFSSRLTLKSWSQEFQLVSNRSSNLEWVAGLYAFHSKGGFDPVGVWFPRAQPATSAAIADSDLIIKGTGSAKAYAAYGQASYTFFDRLKITGGLRYSWEKRSLDDQTITVPGVGEIFRELPLSKSWNSLTPKIGIDYSWDRHMLYASYTQGFRSGSYNLVSVGTPGPVNPEKVKAWEVGGKHTLATGVRFNWAAFYYKYKDLQVSRELNNGSGSLFFTQNAASATIKGLEADLSVTAIENLNLDFGVGYLHARYNDFPGAGAFLPGPSGYGYVSVAVDASGRPLARAPNWTASFAATYTIPVGESHLDLSGSVYYTDDYFLDTPSNVKVDSFAILNARATYFLPGEHVSVAAFVNNAFDKRYLATLSTSQDALFGTPNDPRIIGVTVAFKY
jgi:iron complex outermembrane receptor protein